jgi:hypothetical protein
MAVKDSERQENDKNIKNQVNILSRQCFVFYAEQYQGNGKKDCKEVKKLSR